MGHIQSSDWLILIHYFGLPTVAANIIGGSIKGGFPLTLKSQGKLKIFQCQGI